MYTKLERKKSVRIQKEQMGRLMDQCEWRIFFLKSILLVMDGLYAQRCVWYFIHFFSFVPFLQQIVNICESPVHSVPIVIVPAAIYWIGWTKEQKRISPLFLWIVCFKFKRFLGDGHSLMTESHSNPLKYNSAYDDMYKMISKSTKNVIQTDQVFIRLHFHSFT